MSPSFPVLEHVVPVSAGEKLPPARLLPDGVMRPFVLVSGLFLLWGVPNAMNDVLIRQFMKSFAISRFEAGLVQSAFYLGYFTLALPAGALMKRRGYKAGFLTGLILFATGCFMFYPAALYGGFPCFLAALFIVASGLAFLETASNPFVAQLGSTATSEARLNLAQAFNPVGYFLGVLVGTVFIFSGTELSAAQIGALQAAGEYQAYMHSETLRVVAPYIALGVLALGWAVMLAITKMPAFLRHREHDSESVGNWKDLLKLPNFLFAVPAQFCYCGAQVGAWSYFIQYAKEYGSVTEKKAGVLLACIIAGFGVGRFLATYLMRFVSPVRLMLVYALANAGLMVVAMTSKGPIGIAAIMSTGLFFSLMFPTIFALGLKGAGPNTNIAGSCIVMAIVGGAVVTPLMGWVAEQLHSTALSYQVPAYGCLFIAGYAYYMKRRRRTETMHSTFEV